MIPDEPLTQIIRSQVIKGGQSIFEKYLADTLAKKNEKKRKQKDQPLDKKQDYSVVNLIKIERQKLSSNELLANELLRTRFEKTNEKDIADDFEKYYDDFEAAQRLNEKVIRRFMKPVKNICSSILAKSPLQNPLQMFKTQYELFLEKQTEIQLNNLDYKIHPRPKLQTKKQMLQQIDQNMIYFASDIKLHYRQMNFHQKLNKSHSQSIKNMCQQFKQHFASDGITNPSYKYQKSLQKFESLVQQQLPSYLRQSQYQLYSPLPWRTSILEKQLARTSYQQINGKIFYKYEHNIGEIKENVLKRKIYEVEEEGFQEMKMYLEEKQNEKQKMKVKKEQFVRKESKSWNNLAQDKNRQNTQLSNQSLLSNSSEVQKRHPKLYSQQTQIPKNNNFPNNNRPQNSTILNSNKIQNFINFRTAVPKSSKFIKTNQQQLNLDHKKYSKHNQYLHNYSDSSNFSLQKNANKRSKQTPRNIVYAQTNIIQSPLQKKASNTRHSKLPIKVVQIHHQHRNIYYHHSSQQQQSQSSQESNFFDTMTQYKQKKTTKKKKSFLKKTPPKSSSSFGQIKIKQNRSVILSKKGDLINFYPLKIGNLILQRKNYAYIEYNSAKQQLKNLTVKFLIDRLRHGVNSVQIVAPSFGYQNQQALKVNDQQKAKQMIKTILALGGNIQKIKGKSSYDQKISVHQQQKNRPKISTEIQIYKFFYKDLSYFQIIDALNLEKQWMESEKNSRKIGGWMY